MTTEEIREEFEMKYGVFGLVDLEAVGEDNIFDFFITEFHSLLASQKEELIGELKKLANTRILLIEGKRATNQRTQGYIQGIKHPIKIIQDHE